MKVFAAITGIAFLHTWFLVGTFYVEGTEGTWASPTFDYLASLGIVVVGIYLGISIMRDLIEFD